jgi:hypothetical protein
MPFPTILIFPAIILFLSGDWLWLEGRIFGLWCGAMVLSNELSFELAHHEQRFAALIEQRLILPLVSRVWIGQVPPFALCLPFRESAAASLV